MWVFFNPKQISSKVVRKVERRNNNGEGSRYVIFWADLNENIVYKCMELIIREGINHLIGI